MRDTFEGYELEDGRNDSDDSSDDDSVDSDSDSDAGSDDSDGGSDDSDDDSDDGSDDNDSDDDSDDDSSGSNGDDDDDSDDDEEKGATDKLIKDKETVDTEGRKVSGKKKKKKVGGVRELWIHAKVSKEEQIFSKDNVGLPLTYLVLGLTQGFLLPLLNDLPKDLGLTTAEQGSINAIYYLPWYFQIFLAFVSDSYSIRGYRRKPYMTVGWLLGILAIACLMIFSDSSHTPGTTPASNSPSVGFLTTTLFFYGFGSTLATVATDGMIVGKYLLEADERKGHFLITCLAFKFFGFLISVPTGHVIYQNNGSGALFFLLAAFPFLLLPTYWFVREQDLKGGKLAAPKVQVINIWETVKSKAVYQSLGSLCFYMFLQIQNTALDDLLLSEGLTDSDLNLTVTMGILLLFFGILVYKKFFMLRNWKHVYLATTVATAVLSLSQLLMANGVANLPVAIIHRMLSGFVEAFELVPVLLIIGAISLKGSEATTFAMFMSIGTFAMGVATSISVSLQGRFNISKETLSDGSAGSMPFLIVIVTALPIVGLLGIRFLPTDRAVINSWKDTKKLTMGLCLLSSIALSIFYALVVSLLSFVVYEVAASG